MDFYLISTDHLCEQLWCKDDEDFKVAMNYIAVVVFITGVTVLGFALMSNHVHFVVEASYDAAENFINQYKRLYAAYYRRKYGVSKFLRRNKADIRLLEYREESVERGIAYTLMNPVAANICLHPTGYRWSSCESLFRERPAKGRPLKDFSQREQARILRSRIQLPQDWLLGEDGYILPDSFVAVRFVESLFRTPKRLVYFLNNSSKAKARLHQREEGLPSFRDQVILSALPDLSHSLFRKQRFEDLTEGERAELIHQIRFRFSADLHQIARILGLPYPEVARLLDLV